MTPEVAVRWLADLSPVDATADPDLDRSLAFLGSDLGSRTVRRAASGVALYTAALAALSFLLGHPVAAAGVAVVGSGLGYATLAAPGWLATARRSRALGAGPDLVALAALRLRIEPAPERAAAFAANQGRGPLAASLRGFVRRARGTPRTGWDGFVEAWADWDPSLRRATSLLEAAADAPPPARDRLLDRALDTVLDGARDRVADYAARIQGPTSAIYAFGVVLPLALAAVLPAARGAGVPVTLSALVVGYDLLLPAVLILAGAALLGRRPVAFPPASVPRDHPDVPDSRPLRTALCLLGGAAGAWVGVGLFAPHWTRPVAATGLGFGAALVCWYDPVHGVRRRVRAVERGLGDALALVGQRLRRGESVETAVSDAGATLDGPVGEVLTDAAHVQRTLRVPTRAAFDGDYGALASVPSPRARASAALLSLAGREGPHGGRVLVEMADHLDDVAAVRESSRRALARTVGVFRSTAYCVAPLIGGTTVALAGSVGTGVDGSLPPLPTPELGLVVGVYVLALAVILSSFATALESGVDRAAVGRDAGIALCAAGVVFPVTVAAGTLLVNV